MKLNIGLDNQELYAGCEIKEVGGRLSLISPPAEAANVIGRNTVDIIAAIKDRSQITLTGAMAVWAYLIVFHIVVHKFAQVWYDDGRGGVVQIAQH